MKPLKVVSFFSGCGGLDLGLEGDFWVKAKSVKDKTWIKERHKNFVKLAPTAFQTVFACDIKPSAKKAWEYYFQRDNVFHLESIVELVKKAKEGTFTFPNADVVTGGFPCQDFSVAGKRKGFDSHKTHKNAYRNAIDTPTIESRGMLYFWLREAIALIKPKIFIAENVKGLVSMKDVKEIMTQDFRTIGEGYVVLDPNVLHAGNYGVPQTRERIIFIGVRKDILSEDLHVKLQNGEFSLYPEPTHDIKHDFVTVKDALFDLCEPEQSEDLSHQKYSKAKWFGKHCQGQTEINPNKLAPTIRAEHHGNIEFRRLSKEHGGLIEEEYHLPERRLSVRECARLQTFPDDYAFVSEKLGASEAYKLIGNAVPPLLAYHIAKKLEAFLALCDEMETKKNTKKVA
ncbi:DNA cytosine methyltransferase [Sulfurospirillum deleyianum]|uniref:Cytosine-specific methyltransferase n=1 Tax=Sulfurospirillum deleyianum (strain ATCC 51133 / DSM 6946 / 5175) TaxID=525898 RepID=D1B4K6_SULD5|nr:DNA (cytosine-5-)-methyltransferase [Sulfurospirillum deleyianum]ACZ13026.1 DNA-cytosine methyltransferase [Sulfurospirillum deleyianum DSM 6946]